MNKRRRTANLGFDLIEHFKQIRVIIVLILIVIICIMYSSDLLFSASFTQSPLNAIDCFLLMLNNSYTVLCLTAGILLINSNAPFFTNTQPYVFVRLGRRNWLISKLMLLSFNTLVFLIFVLAVSIITTAGHAYLGNLWSIPLMSIASGANSFIPNGFPADAISLYSPFEYLFHSFALMLLYYVFLSLIILFINMNYNRNYGFQAALFITFIGWVMDFLAAKQWTIISPIHNSMLIDHNYGFTYGPSITFSYAYFVFLIGLLIFFMFKNIEKYDF